MTSRVRDITIDCHDPVAPGALLKRGDGPADGR
jgi:hypothetical protein